MPLLVLLARKVVIELVMVLVAPFMKVNTTDKCTLTAVPSMMSLAFLE